MTDTQIHRHDNPYTVIPNHIPRDESLSLDARGFLCLIMTMASAWKFRRSNLMKTCGIGKDKYHRITNELKNAGYLVIENIHGSDGRITGARWNLYDNPASVRETRTPGSPTGGETRTVKKEQEDIRKNNGKDIRQEAVNFYNSKAQFNEWPEAKKMTEARNRTLDARISDADGLDGWKAAIQAAADSDFLSGRSGKWAATFDWLCKQANFTKLIEGNYSNRTEIKDDFHDKIEDMLNGNQVEPRNPNEINNGSDQRLLAPVDTTGESDGPRPTSEAETDGGRYQQESSSILRRFKSKRPGSNNYGSNR